MERLDRAFFRGAYDARHLLMTLAEQTRSATDTTTLAEMIDHAVVEALHPSTLLVYLRGGDDTTFEAAAHGERAWFYQSAGHSGRQRVSLSALQAALSHAKRAHASTEGRLARLREQLREQAAAGEPQPSGSDCGRACRRETMTCLGDAA